MSRWGGGSGGTPRGSLPSTPRTVRKDPPVQAPEEVVEEKDEAMANAERELAEDAEWKRIQQNTFTRWVNEHLRQAGTSIEHLETDFSDGLKLIALLEVLSGKKMWRHNKKTTFRSQKLENVSIALSFLESEGVHLVNIDSTDITDCKLKLILGLIWTLILHYSISMPMYDGPELGGKVDEKTPKQRLMGWLQNKLPNLPINNFTTDWKDGRKVGALVDSVAPGLCPDWEHWDPNEPVRNATEAMDLADSWLGVPKLLTPEEIVNPNVDEMSMMTYLSQFPNAKMKEGAPLRAKAVPSKVRAYGPGLEPTGVVAKAPANFTVETFGAGDGELAINVKGPNDVEYKADKNYNNDRKKSYSCSYYPDKEGPYVVNVLFARRDVPSSPFNVLVEGFAGDAAKVTAAGPGLEPEGVVASKPTYFEIFTAGAGKGKPEVIVLDPAGRKDTVPAKICPGEKDTFRCDYMPQQLGVHSVNVFFAGNPIPNSPFGVKVGPASNAGKVTASGRGLQPHGLRALEPVDFKVFTEGAGDGVASVKIIGPGGVVIPTTHRNIDPHTIEYKYTPEQAGKHVVMITWAGKEIPRSPFNVTVSPQKTSKIKAFGPGLKGGIVDMPALFTVDTCGETGALGFSIEGPSQAKINCKDNGDGSADVDYTPTVQGEYAVHILCDNEDIPGSPFMAQILPKMDYNPDKVKCYGPGIEGTVIPKQETHFTIDTTKAGKAPLDVSIMDDYGERKPLWKDANGVSDPNDGGIMAIKLLKAKELIKSDIIGKSDPYAVIRHGSQKYTTKVAKNTQEPEWNYEAQVTLPDQGDKTITIEVFDKDKIGKDKSLGMVSFDTATVVKQKDIPADWYPLEGVSSGQILLSADFLPAAPSIYKAPEAAMRKTSHANLEVQRPVLEQVSEGIYECRYIPRKTKKQVVNVNFGGVAVPGSPFRVNVDDPTDPAKVKVYGPGVEPGVKAKKPVWFTVDCTKAGPGDMEVNITDDKRRQVAVAVKDTGVGTYHAEYTAEKPGMLFISVKYDGRELPQSPIKVEVKSDIDLSKIKVNDLSPDAFVDCTSTFGVDAGGVLPQLEGGSAATKLAGKVACTVTAPDGSSLNNVTVGKPSDKGEVRVGFTPREEGKHGVNVVFDGEKLPGFPQIVQARKGADAGRVKAYGPGLEKALVGLPNQFTVETRNAGAGALGIQIEGPAEVKMTCTDNEDGTCSVEYIPEEEGPHEVNVKYDDRHISQSPFKVPCSYPAGSDGRGGVAGVKDLLGKGHDGQGGHDGQLPQGGLHINLIKAKELIKADIIGKSDPYAVLKYGNQTFRTKTVNNSLEPVWDCEVDFSVPEGLERVVAIEVFDADKFGKDKSLGKLLLDIEEVAAQGRTGEGRWYPLTSAKSGQVLLTADFLLLGDSDSGADPQGGLAAAKRLRDNLEQRGKKDPGLVRGDSKGHLGDGSGAGDPTGRKGSGLAAGAGGAAGAAAALAGGKDKDVVDGLEGDLQVKLVKARNLVKADIVGKSDPYAVLKYGRQKQKTGTIKNTLEPQWDFNTQFKVPDGDANMLNIEVFDADRLGKDKSLGKVDIPITHIANASEGRWFPLTGVKSGEILLHGDLFKGGKGPTDDFGQPSKIKGGKGDGPADASKVKAYGPGLEKGKVQPGVLADFTIDSTKTGPATIDVNLVDGDGSVFGKTPSITPTDATGISAVKYLPPSEPEIPYKVAVKYGGQDIPGSPFGMNSGKAGDSLGKPGKKSVADQDLGLGSSLGDFEGVLRVDLVRAKNLVKADTIGKSDPYAVLTYGKQKDKTNTIKNTLEPVWNHPSEFKVPDGNANMILIEVFDADKFGKDKPLGRVEVDILDLTAEEGRWYPLQGVKSGEILLNAELLPLGSHDRKTSDARLKGKHDVHDPSVMKAQDIHSLKDFEGTLAVDLVKARNLIKADMMGKSDPYAILSFGKQKEKTDTVKNSLEPVWNHHAEFQVPDGLADKILVEVFDADKFGKDKPLGKVEVNIRDLPAGEGRWFPLQGVKSGEILLSADLLPPGTSSPTKKPSHEKLKGDSDDMQKSSLPGSLDHSPLKGFEGTVLVELVKAKNLIKADMMGKSDPYAVLTFGNQKDKTKTMKNTQEPEWNHQSEFQIPDHDADKILVEVFDADKFGKGKSLGKVEVKIDDLPSGDGKWFPLQGVKSGEILLNADLIPLSHKGLNKKSLDAKTKGKQSTDQDEREKALKAGPLEGLEGTLLVDLIKAKDLIKADIIGKSDPYAILTFGKQKDKTNTVKNTLDPQWDHQAEFKIPDGEADSLLVEVFDADKLGKDKSLGKAEVKIGDMTEGEGRWIPLKGVKSGEILLNVDILPLGASDFSKRPQDAKIKGGKGDVPADASKVKAFGPGIENGKVLPGLPTNFTVDSSKTGPGSIDVEIKDADGEALSAKPKIEATEKPGVFDVSYLPPSSDKPYEVGVKYAGQDIPGSPFGMTAGHGGKPLEKKEIAKPTGPLGGFEGDLKVGLIKARNLLKTDIMGKSDPYAVIRFGKQKDKTSVIKNTLEPQWDFYTSFKVPDGEADNILVEVFDSDKLGKDKSLGKADIDVKELNNSDGLWIPLQGVKSGEVLVNAELVARGEAGSLLPDGKSLIKGGKGSGPADASKVKAFGPGLEKGKIQPGVPANFVIDSSKTGPATVDVELLDGEGREVGKKPVMAPGESPGVIDASYLPPLPEGKPYQVDVKYGGQHVPGSPFHMAAGHGGLPLHKGAELSGMDSLSDNKGLIQTGPLANFEGLLHVDLIKAKNLLKTDIMGKSDPYAVLKFGKQKEKTNTLKNTSEPQWDFGTDFKVPDGNADKLLVEVFDSDKLGKDKSLGKVEIKLDELQATEGKWFSLQGVKSGEVLLNADLIPHGDKASQPYGNLPAKIKGGKGDGPADASKVKAYGPGLEKGKVMPGSPAHFTVDSSKTGPASIDVDIQDKNGAGLGKKPSIAASGPGHHDVTYLPPPIGEPYMVDVKYGGQHIPGSPFTMTSSPDLEDVTRSPHGTAHEGTAQSKDPRKASKIGVSVNPDSENLGKIHVSLIEAKDLAKADIIGKSDPYAVLSHGNQKFRTNTAKNTQNPKWNYDADFNVPDQGDDRIRVDIFDSDKIGKDKPLGSAFFDVGEVMAHGILPPGWYPLKGAKSGEVLMSADFEALDVNKSRLCSPDKELTKGQLNKNMKQGSTDKLLANRDADKGDTPGPFDGILHLDLLGARNLIKSDLIGKSDPYARLQLGEEVYKTDVVKNTQNPEWNFSADFNVERKTQNDEVKISVFDYDKLGKDKSLGTLGLPLEQLLAEAQNPNFNRWFPLAGVKSGEVLVASHFLPLDPDAYRRMSGHGIGSRQPGHDGDQPKSKLSTGRGASGLAGDLRKQRSSDHLNKGRGRGGDGLEGDLNLILVQARNLPKSDLIGNTDPYAVISCGSDSSRTQTIKDSQNPVWNHEAAFSINPESASALDIQILDADTLGKDKPLGSLRLDIEDLAENGPLVDMWLPLENAKSGEIQVAAEFFPKGHDDPDSSGSANKNRQMSGILKEPGRRSEADGAKDVLPSSGSRKKELGDDDLIPGTLHLDLIQAKDLMKGDLIGKSDPFGLISFDDEYITTPTVKNSQNPEWNYRADIPINSSGPKEVKIAVFDSDRNGKHKPLGSTVVNVGDVINGDTLDKDWISLDGVKTGKIQVSAIFSPELGQSSPESRRHSSDVRGAKGTREILQKQKPKGSHNKSTDDDEYDDYAASPMSRKKSGELLNEDFIPAGNIHLEILEAKDLVKADILGKSDPYAIVSLGDHLAAKTPVVKNNQNPKWNFSTSIPVDDGSPRMMNIEIFDSDKHGKDKSLGNAVIDVKGLIDDNPIVDTWLPLQGAKSGKVRVSADFTPEEDDFDTIKRKKGAETKTRRSDEGIPKDPHMEGRKQSGDARDRKESSTPSDMRRASGYGSSQAEILGPGTVHVKIIQAKDLIKTDLIGKSDPYAVLTHGKDKVKSNVVKNSQNPKWNFEVDIPVDQSSDKNLKIDLFDSDRFGKDKPLGSVGLDINNIADGNSLKDAWIPLSGAKSGHLQLSVEYEPLVGNDGEDSRPRNLQGQLGGPRKGSEVQDHSDWGEDNKSPIYRKASQENNIPKGNLHLNIIQGKDLMKKDIIGKSDPYAVISYGNDKIQSKSVKNTQNPEWNFEADIPVDHHGPQSVKVEIFDEDKYGKDKPLGSMDIDLTEVVNGGPLDKAWVPLNGVKSGLVQISANFEDSENYGLRRASSGGDYISAESSDPRKEKAKPSRRGTQDSLIYPGEEHGPSSGQQKKNSKDYDRPSGNLHVTIIQGKDLEKTDIIGKSDPYAVVTYGNEKIRTRTVSNSQNPEWNFEASLPLYPNGPTSFTVDVYDDDKLGQDKPIGSTVIDIPSIVNSRPLDEAWIPLDGTKSGQIQISAVHERDDLESPRLKKTSGLGGALGLKNRLKSPDRKSSSRSRTPSDDIRGSRKASAGKDVGSKGLGHKPSTGEQIVPGNLHLNIVRGKDLVKSDLIGKSDPYVVVSYGNEKVKTQTVKNSQNPEFNFETDIPIYPGGPEKMRIEVFDKDKFGKDKSLGVTELPVAKLQQRKSSSDIWIPLDNVKSGQLQILTDFHPEDPDLTGFPTGPGSKKDSLPRNGGGAPVLKDQLSSLYPAKNDGYEYDHGSLGDPRYSKDKGDPSNDKLGTIKLDLLCAKDLQDADLIGKSDPYAIISYGTQKYKTEIKNNTLNPEWNIQCDIQVPEGNERNINIALYDADGNGKDDFLGEYNIDIGKIMNLGSLDQSWHPLSGTKSGEICIGADFVPDLASSIGRSSETTIFHQQFKDRFSTIQFHEVSLNKIPLPSAGGRIEATIRRPSGHVDIPMLEDNNNGTVAVKYQPSEEGLHYLDVKYNGDQVQGSPFKFHVNAQNAGQAFAYGPGLTHGVCGEPANFSISTKGAGAGGLSLAVEGPSKAEINCLDNKDGTVSVSYMPTAPGEYKITAKFADKHIPGSPFTCKITGEGKKRNQISVGSSSELQLPGDLSEADIRSLKAFIQNPSGGIEQCFLKRLPQGNIGISFTPREVGEHLVSVQKNGKHIANSPFKIIVNAQEVGDSSRVRVGGEGLERGQTHVYNRFQINTKSAGYGGLSLSIEGPSKAEIECKDNEDGTLDVDYKPTEPGFYIINIKFADSHVPGSPFQVPVSGEGSEKQRENIHRMREAVPLTEVGSQCRLTFKMPGIHIRDLAAAVTSPSGITTPAQVGELEEGLYSVNFVPRELGIHTVRVSYREMDIPGSPFQFTVGPLQDSGAHRVHAGGPGLERGVEGEPAEFNVWTREAGPGSLAISVEGPSKAQIDFKDRKDGSCYVSYIVEEPGEYSVGIRFNEQHIPDSPYRVFILPRSDHADKVSVSNFDKEELMMNAPQSFLLNKNGAAGSLECKMVSPSGREDDCFLSQVGQDEYSVRFVPKEAGVHYLHARLDGVHVPGSPFKIKVGGSGRRTDGHVRVSGRGLERIHVGQRASFVIDTSEVGAGTLSVTVDGPSKVDMDCEEVETGYRVSYTPTIPGDYFVTVKYNGGNVEGSPFKVTAFGGGAAGTGGTGEYLKARRESTSMTMETIQHMLIRQESTFKQSHVVSSRSSSRQIPIQFDSDASLCSMHGDGLDRPAIGKQNSFLVDCSRGGSNVLFVGVYGPDTPCDEVFVKHQGGKQYAVSYRLKEPGQYVLYVKWGDEHVPGSPYQINV